MSWDFAEFFGRFSSCGFGVVCEAEEILLRFTMVAGAADCLHQSIPVLDVPYRCIAKEIEEIVDISAAAAAAAAAAVVAAAAPPSPVFRQAERVPEAVPAEAEPVGLSSSTFKSSFLASFFFSFDELYLHPLCTIIFSCSKLVC